MQKRILITDDSSIMRRNMNTILSQAGYIISAEASNEQEALKAYRKHRPDLITIDISMPVMDGLETVKRIIKEDPEARIIVICDFHQSGLLFEAMENGAASLLIKPVTTDKLLAAVRQVLDQDQTARMTAASLDVSPRVTLMQNKGPYFTVAHADGRFVILLNDPLREGPYPDLETAVQGLMFVRPLNVVFDFGASPDCDLELAMTIESLIGLIRGAGGKASVVAGQENLAALLRRIISVPIAAEWNV